MPKLPCLLAFIGYATLMSGAKASMACQTKVVPDPAAIKIVSSSAQLIVDSANGECRIRRLVTPKFECQISFGFEHGHRGFYCGGSFSGYWGVAPLDAGPSGMSVSVVGPSRNVRLPKHRELRRAWLAPIDTEGWHQSYPIRMDQYVDLYPRTFIHIGRGPDLSNPDLKVRAQTLRYITMNDRSRVAVTGEAGIGCLKLNFVTWSEPSRSDELSKDMASFLEDLRLEPVDAADPNYDRHCGRTSR